METNWGEIFLSLGFFSFLCVDVLFAVGNFCIYVFGSDCSLVEWAQK